MQNIVTMLVAHDREGHIILAVTGNENARFECKIDESFENARRESATAIGTGSYLFEIGIGFQHGLAVAVVPAGTGFQHGRVMDFTERRIKLLNAVDGLPWCGRRAMIVDELLLVDTILVTRSKSVPCGAADKERTSSMASAFTFRTRT